MHFLFNKSDNSHCFHTEDENDVNLKLIHDSDQNYYINIPDFDANNHPDFYGPEDIYCCFWDPDNKVVYLPTDMFMPNYPHGKKYLIDYLTNINTTNISDEQAAQNTIMISLAKDHLPPEIFNEIMQDNIITPEEAELALNEILSGLINDTNNNPPG